MPSGTQCTATSPHLLDEERENDKKLKMRSTEMVKYSACCFLCVNFVYFYYSSFVLHLLLAPACLYNLIRRSRSTRADMLIGYYNFESVFYDDAGMADL